MKKCSYLGVDTRGNYRQGCLQDIHWTDGSFGYFPSYTLGAMYAAQYFAVMRRNMPDLDQRIAAGDLSAVFGWLDRISGARPAAIPQPNWSAVHAERP
jgi:carboxypeptidase Taq